MDDPHLSALVSVLFHLREHDFQGFGCTAALVERLQGALAAGLAYDADAQQAAGFGDQGRYAAVLRHVVQAFQSENQAGPLHIAADLCLNLIKGFAGLDELPQLLRDHDQLGTGGQAVKTADPASRMLRLIMLLCLDRRVIAAGKAAGDGQGKYAVGVSEGVQPFLNIGAGGAGASLVGGEIGEHFLQVQLRIIHEFLLVGDDLQRHAGKAGVLHGKNVGRRICYNLKIHIATSISAGSACQILILIFY